MTGGRKNKKDNEIKDRTGDIPGGPVVKTSPFNAGGVGWIPGRGTKIPHASVSKNQELKTEAIL